MAYHPSYNTASNGRLPPIQSIFAFLCERCDQRFPRAEERNQHRCSGRAQAQHIVTIYQDNGFQPPPPSPALTSMSSGGSSYDTMSSRASSVSPAFARCDLGPAAAGSSHKKAKRSASGKTPGGRVSQVGGVQKLEQDPKKIENEKTARKRQAACLQDLEDVKRYYYAWAGTTSQRASNGSAAGLLYDKQQNLLATAAGFAWISEEVWKLREQGQPFLFDGVQEVMNKAIVKDANSPLTGTFLAEADGRHDRCVMATDSKTKHCNTHGRYRYPKTGKERTFMECRRDHTDENWLRNTAAHNRRSAQPQPSRAAARRPQHGRL